MMKNRLTILLLAAIVASVSACRRDDIEPYRLENSSVIFHSESNEYSLKGIYDPTITLRIPVDLVGPTAGYDREMGLRVVSDDERSTAVENEDFRIVGKTLRAGEYSGEVVIEVNNLGSDEDRKSVVLELCATPDFIYGIPRLAKVKISWSKEYVRPEEGVWRYWYTYICHGYSKAFHELLIQVCGEEIEYSTCRKAYVEDNPMLVYQLPNWWYGMSRKFYNYVADYNREHPDAPLMHSDDFRAYSSYLSGVDEGKKVEPTPGIFETLESL